MGRRKRREAEADKRKAVLKLFIGMFTASIKRWQVRQGLHSFAGAGCQGPYRLMFSLTHGCCVHTAVELDAHGSDVLAGALQRTRRGASRHDLLEHAAAAPA